MPPSRLPPMCLQIDIWSGINFYARAGEPSSDKIRCKPTKASAKCGLKRGSAKRANVKNQAFTET